MSKDQTAPGRLESVRAFINTLDVEEGTEQLDSPRALSRWFEHEGLLTGRADATAADLENAIRLREALRAIVLAHNSGDAIPEGAVATLDDTVCRARLVLRFRDSGSAVEKREPQTAAKAAILTSGGENQLSVSASGAAGIRVRRKHSGGLLPLCHPYRLRIPMYRSL